MSQLKKFKKDKSCFIICASPLTENIVSRIGYNYLNTFFNVYIIDIINIVSKNFKKDFSYNQDDKIKSCVIEIDKFDELSTSIKKINPIFLVDRVGRSRYTNIIQEICINENIRYVYDQISQAPLNGDNSSLKGKVLSFFINKFTYKLMKFVSKAIIPPDIVLLGGTNKNYWISLSNNIIHTTDHSYLLFKKILKSEKKIHPRKYILFLDDCLAQSFDFNLSYELVLDKKKYINDLNKFFTFLENKFKINVVIAAHPNGLNFKEYDKLFFGRTVYFNKSAELSKDCLFAMTHYSRSIQYPILFKKPIIQLDLVEFKNKMKYAKSEILLREKLLNIKTIMINNHKKKYYFPEKFLSVNTKLYEKFINKFISFNNKSDFKNPYEPLVTYFLSN